MSALVTSVERFAILDQISNSLHFKILLLGAGESGKSTVIKQLRNIYLGKFAISPDEIQSYTSVLHTNSIQAMKVLLRACNLLQIPLEDVKALAEHVYELDEQELLLKPDADAIRNLWDSDPIKKAYSQKSQVYVPGTDV